MAKEFDLVIFGATGFTGKHAIPAIQKLTKDPNYNYSWAVAGRSQEKLKQVLEECGTEIGVSLSHIPIIVADVQDENSLKEMARKSRIIVNFCGPYRFYGEAVVKACVEEGAHHVDISGEPHYMENMQLKYGDEARQKNIYIVSACGFDSIPADLGLVFLERNFEGTLNSVETYMEIGVAENAKKPIINYGTWESLIYGMAHSRDLGPLRKKLFPSRLPTYNPKLKLKSKPHQVGVVSGWAVPFLGADRSVIKRTQYYKYEIEKKRPTQIETYVMIKSYWALFLMLIYGVVAQLLIKYNFGRKLLLKYPSLFSCGFFGKTTPDEETARKSTFSVTLYGEGWKQKFANPNEECTAPHDTSVCVKVSGNDPGYRSTAMAALLSALTILSEKDKLPAEGGVFPPGATFAKTTLIDRLIENNIKFEVVFKKDIQKSLL